MNPHLFALALSLCICAVCYSLAHTVPPEYRDWLAWPLLPGVAVYTVINGSLLFGSGFGARGNFVLVVTCSAIAWAALFGVVRHAVRHWLRPQSR